MKKNLVVTLLGLGAVLLTVWAAVSFQAGAAEKKSTVGYIDMDQIQKEVKDFKDFQEYLQNKNAELNSFVQYIQTQFINTKNRLEKERDEKKKGKSADEQAAIDKEYTELINKYETEHKNKIEAENARLSAEAQQELNKIKDKLKSKVEEVAEKEGISIVLDKKLIYYGGTDLTGKVIAAMKDNKDNNAK